MDGIHKGFSAWTQGYHDLFSEISLSDIFPATIMGRLHQMQQAQRENAKRIPSRGETGQDKGGRYERLDQLVNELLLGIR